MKWIALPCSLFLLAGVILETGCTLVPNSKKFVNLTIELPAFDRNLKVENSSLETLDMQTAATTAVPPTTVDGFDCYAINVFGPGIPGDLSGDGSSSIPPLGCSYLGIGSALLVPPQSTATLTVPSGPGRTVQVIGIATGNGCPTGPIRDYLKSLKATYGTGPIPVSLVELGTKTVDLFKDTDVEIQNTFVSGTSSTLRFPFRCPDQTTPGTVLALKGAFSGDTINSTFSDTLSATLPPSGTMDIDTAAYTALSNPYNANPVYFSTPSLTYFKKVDFVFDASSINLSSFSTLSVEARFVGGVSSNVSSTCTLPSAILAGGAEIRVYDSTGAGWTVAKAVNTSASLGYFTFTPGRAPADLAINETGTPTGRFFHVSIRSKVASTASFCSTLGIQFIRVSVVP